jgi:hypothetical protein
MTNQSRKNDELKDHRHLIFGEALVVVAKSNDVYGVPDRRYVTNISKARELTSGDLARVTDPYTRMSPVLRMSPVDPRSLV